MVQSTASLCGTAVTNRNIQTTNQDAKFLPSQHAQLQRLIVHTNAVFKRVANRGTSGRVKLFCCWQTDFPRVLKNSRSKTFWNMSTICTTPLESNPSPQKSQNYPKNVKCTIVQALRSCTDRTAHSGSRGIAILFLDHSTRGGEG